ncbi:MAG: 16S rRNA (uracil(1498)-N(3))-methyltransferase [Cytophagaceae bacterium]|nr:16S rRNA (uracil(1498)-N(3))-methyltransferase [Cytophagaceae bacterium]MDW8457234.1 16S rRNA (uracil(1498)-N(3))-methyltransferase [Cytophagaceae bacterium]
MHVFYTPHPEMGYTLNQEESEHAVRVLRMKAGDVAHLADGRGSLYEILIKSPDARSCGYEIRNKIKSEPENSCKLSVAIALTKQAERMEWFVEKAVEIGVSAIHFIVSVRTERSKINLARIHKIAVSAMKQSTNLWLPVFSGPITFAEFIAKDANEQKYIAHLEDENRKLFSSALIPNKTATILIGPEGDFSAEEISKAKNKEYVPVSLGNNRLRTETAGIMACAIAAMKRMERTNS